ncbi:MAG: APC family permease [Oscillatoria princeps RMCB-10]|nr:APC family permease [Oscillatoria princeps RMCB-10]
MSEENPPRQLKRELGWFGAGITGLASVIGVGIFVSIGIAAGISGTAVIAALVVAGLLGACNSLNLAQLAASNPVSGGIYEYGYKYLTPSLGFTGGWIYLLSKVAVAATAALGFAGYLLNATGWGERHFLVPVAEAAVFIITLIVLGGMQRSKVSTIAVVSVTVFSLLFLIVAGLFVHFPEGFETLLAPGKTSSNWLPNFLHSVALMFVSYNGAARITMVGEEIVDPRKNIPKAVILTVIITLLLYLGVAVVSLGSIGAEAFSAATAEKAAPLEVVAESFGIPGAGGILAAGAVASMLSILLTTVLGVSRLLLAMGRRGDMPSFFAQLNSAGTTPYWAVIFLGTALALLVLTGDVRTTWAFGTFGAMYRCVIVSLAALRMSDEERMYPKWLSWVSLFSGLFLAFWVEWYVWSIGLGLIGIGLIWHWVAHRIKLAGQLKLAKF